MPDFVGEAVLAGFPLLVWRRQQEYTNDLLREFQLLTTSRTRESTAVPAKLLAVADDFLTRYGSLSVRLTTEREAALERGEVTQDSVVPLPAETPQIVASLRALLVEVEEYCRNGNLLTLAAPADVVALREWTLDEMLRQYEGEPPQRWTGPVA